MPMDLEEFKIKMNDYKGVVESKQYVRFVEFLYYLVDPELGDTNAEEFPVWAVACVSLIPAGSHFGSDDVTRSHDHSGHGTMLRQNAIAIIFDPAKGEPKDCAEQIKRSAIVSEYLPYLKLTKTLMHINAEKDKLNLACLYLVVINLAMPGGAADDDMKDKLNKWVKKAQQPVGAASQSQCCCFPNSSLPGVLNGNSQNPQNYSELIDDQDQSKGGCHIL